MTNIEYGKNPEKCQFWKVDVDKNDRVAAINGVKSFPTFKVFKGGVQVCSESFNHMI
jgi:thioredoxin-like negative regulator of GroEL